MKVVRYINACLVVLSFSFAFFLQVISSFVLDKETYQTRLEQEPVQNKIDSLLISATGLWQLKPLDEQTYQNVFYLIKSEVIGPLIESLPELWTDWLAGRTNHFDPMLDLHETRGKVIWVLRQAVNDKLPATIAKSLEAKIEKNFSKNVPFNYRLLSLIGLSSNTEAQIVEGRDRFLTFHRKLGWLWFVSIVLALAWFWSFKDFRRYGESLLGFIGGTALLFFLPLWLFSKNIVGIAGTIVRLKSTESEWIPIVESGVRDLLDRAILPLGLIAGLAISGLLALALHSLRQSRSKDRV